MISAACIMSVLPHNELTSSHLRSSPAMTKNKFTTIGSSMKTASDYNSSMKRRMMMDTANPFSNRNIDFPSLHNSRTCSHFLEDHDDSHDTHDSHHADMYGSRTASIFDKMDGSRWRGMKTSSEFDDTEFNSANYRTASLFDDSKLFSSRSSKYNTSTSSLFDEQDIFAPRRTSSKIPDPVYPSRTSSKYFAGEYFE